MALVAVSGLYEELTVSTDQEEVLVALITQAEQLHNRLVVVDVPPDQENADDALKASEVLEWVDGLRELLADGQLRRSAIVYYPRLWVLIRWEALQSLCVACRRRVTLLV